MTKEKLNKLVIKKWVAEKVYRILRTAKIRGLTQGDITLQIAKAHVEVQKASIALKKAIEEYVKAL